MSRINIGAKPYIMPMPVLIVSSYDDDDNPCAMLAVWGGISNQKEISITIASQRHTLKGILARNSFVVSMADVENEVACDYLGITPAEFFDLENANPHKLGSIFAKMKKLNDSQLDSIDTLISSITGK